MRPALRSALQAAALVVVLAALAYSAWFRVTGGHWERVESPSMGTTAPVGTLLWVRPVAAGELRVGDVVSFRQPDRVGGPVYSHRVRAVEADGSFETAGDLSGDDAWTVQPSDVVGRAQWVWPRVGRLVEAAPVLLLGGVVTSGLLLLVRRRARLPIAMLGVSFTLTAAIVAYQPLIGALQLSSTPADGGQAVRMTYVATGLLPVEIGAPGEDHVVLHPGEAGSVVSRHLVDGKLSVDLGPAVPAWFWLLLLGTSFAPSFGSSVVGGRERVAGRRIAVPA